MTDDKLRAAIEQPLWAKSNLKQNIAEIDSFTERRTLLSFVICHLSFAGYRRYQSARVSGRPLRPSSGLSSKA